MREVTYPLRGLREAFEVFLKFGLAAAVFLVWGVQIGLRDKCIVLMAFALRLL